MRSVSSPRAVTMMIGTVERERSSRQTSSPEPSGSPRSSRTRSGEREAASSSASAAVPAISGSKPSRKSASERGAVIDSSSSTNRTVRLFVAMPEVCREMEAVPGESRGPPPCARSSRELACDEAAPHAFRGVVADAAPVRVLDALLEPGGQGGRARLAKDAGLPRLAAALDPEVVRVVAGVANDELDEPGLRLRGQRDSVADLVDADRLSARRREHGNRQDRGCGERDDREGECTEHVADPFRRLVERGPLCPPLTQRTVTADSAQRKGLVKPCPKTNAHGPHSRLISAS